VFIPRGNTPDLATRLQGSGLAAYTHAVATGKASAGHDLSTEQAYDIEIPRLGVLTGEGVNAASYGAHWFFLEQTAGLSFDALPLDRIENTRLERYNVIVAPELSRPNDRVSAALKTWVQSGGTLVAVGNGARNLGAPLAETKLRSDSSRESSEQKVERGLRGRPERELDRWQEQVPGTILPVRLDAAHPLSFGAGIAGDSTRLFVLHSGGAVFDPDPAFETVGHFQNDLGRVSGVISQKNLDRLKQGAWLAVKRVGRGRVILFADDPLFRNFWYSAFQPYMSAILIGPKL
ncbi:MAG: hypothetical protein ACREMA_20855, partial [Longimicrobiales bacterium]